MEVTHFKGTGEFEPEADRPIEWKLSLVRHSLCLRARVYNCNVLLEKSTIQDEGRKRRQKSLIYFKKLSKKKHDVKEWWTSSFEFLKEVLEKDIYLLEQEEYVFSFMGIRRDYSGLPEAKKIEIIYQIEAQVFWYLEKNKFLTIEEMKKFLLKRKHPYFQSLSNRSNPNERMLCNYIRPICPIPKNLRKRGVSKKQIPESFFDKLIPLPTIFSKDKAIISFPRLIFLLRCMTLLLKSLGWSIEAIIESELTKIYTNPLQLYLAQYGEVWIREAFFCKEGRIFIS